MFYFIINSWMEPKHSRQTDMQLPRTQTTFHLDLEF